jgi:hypothetical protein
MSSPTQRRNLYNSLQGLLRLFRHFVPHDRRYARGAMTESHGEQSVVISFRTHPAFRDCFVTSFLMTKGNAPGCNDEVFSVFKILAMHLKGALSLRLGAPG